LSGKTNVEQKMTKVKQYFRRTQTTHGLHRTLSDFVVRSVFTIANYQTYDNDILWLVRIEYLMYLIFAVIINQPVVGWSQ